MKKINIIDIALVVVVVFVAIVGYVYLSGKTVVKKMETVTYNITVEDISVETASQINQGSIMYNSINGKPLGTVEKYNVSPYTEDFFDKTTGEYRKVEKIEHYTIDVVLKTEAEKKDGHYYASDVKLAIGTRVYIRGKNYVCQGKILGVEEVLTNEK